MKIVGALKEEWQRRRERNPRYSLRAYAQHLGLPSSRLSEYFSGKRRLTLSMSRRLTAKLGLGPEESRAARLGDRSGDRPKRPADHRRARGDAVFDRELVLLVREERSDHRCNAEPPFRQLLQALRPQRFADEL